MDPHWDAYLCSGPTSAGPSNGLSSGPNQYVTCPLASAINTGGLPGTYCPNGESVVLTNAGYQCTYDPALVQYVLDATEIFVQHGGNLMAECLGASSLESSFYQGQLRSFGIDQTSTHFMTEWDSRGGMNGYWPTAKYDTQNQIIAPSNLSAPQQNGVVLAGNQCIADPASFPFPRIAPVPFVQPAFPPGAPNFLGWPGDNVLGPLGAGSTVAGGRSHFNGTCPPGSPLSACSEPAPDTQVLVTYGPQNHPTGNATLTDPFLQIGDFYFQGVAGATQGFTEGANTGFPNPPTTGYAWNTNNPDTVVLIRGDPANALAQDTTPTGQTIHADYWLKNHNSTNVGQGTVVYMQGDSFDGRPDGLRMIWSSILNLAFVPNRVELARSSPVGFIPDGGAFHVANDSYLLQGSFEQANYDYAKYTPIFSSASDATQGRWIFPLVRGHLRQYDLQDPNSCFLPLNRGLPQCAAAVVGQGSQTSNFQQNTGTNIYNWDSSENYFNSNLSLLVGTAVTGTVDISKRTIFTHLYQQLTGVGLKPVWLNPGSNNLWGGHRPAPVCSFPQQLHRGCAQRRLSRWDTGQLHPRSTRRLSRLLHQRTRRGRGADRYPLGCEGLAHRGELSQQRLSHTARGQLLHRRFSAGGLPRPLLEPVSGQLLAEHRTTRRSTHDLPQHVRRPVCDALQRSALVGL